MVFYLGFAEDSVDRCFETEDFSTLFASICPAKPGTGRSLGLAVCSIAIPAAVATPAAVAGLFRPFCLVRPVRLFCLFCLVCPDHPLLTSSFSILSVLIIRFSLPSFLSFCPVCPD